MVNINDITITSLDTITAFYINTGSLWFVLDELQDATISQAQETEDITGKGGRKLNTLKKNKTVTISGTNGLLSHGLMEVQTGATFENKTTEVLWTDYLTVTSDAAETSYIAVGTTGAEIEALYIKNTDGTLGTLLTQGDAASEGVFAYDPDTKALTFSGVTDGSEIVVYYKRNIVANVLENSSDVYSGKAILYVDATGEDTCNNVYHIQFYIPKADFSGDFDIAMGDSQTVHDFEAEGLAGSCGTAGVLWTYCIFGENAEDVTDEEAAD